jgi:hypothetical protein
VPHRHVVAIIPRFLRRVFLKRHELLLDLSQSVSDAIVECLRRMLGDQMRPGIVFSMSDHIPDPGKHRTLFYAYYANRVRGERARAEPGEDEVGEKTPKRRRCSPSWARLISKVFDVDPLTCRKCGGKLKIIAYLHDRFAIRKILDHLGLSEPEEERPPPPDVRYVPVDEEGREIATR